MTLAERTIAAAATLGLAAAAPSPQADVVRYRWAISQDAGATDSGADSAVSQPSPPTPAEIEQALRAYQQAAERRMESTK